MTRNRLLTLNRLLCVFVLLGSIGAVAPVDAHPSSTTTVTIDWQPSGAYAVVLRADAAALATKIESSAGNALGSTPLDVSASASARLAALRETIRHHVVLRADDDVRLDPVVEAIDVDETGMASIRFTGSGPSSTKSITFQSDVLFGAYPLAVRSGGKETVAWVDGRASSGAVVLAHTRGWRMARDAVVLGFTHILPRGLDHILFVVGLFLLSGKARQIVWQVSAFTVAHSITLGLSLYGVVSVPSHIVEPLIALSVAYVGVENLMTSTLHPWRIVVVFVFGLLHGMGFAEALAALHLTSGDLITTLIGFNVGVEAGQLTVIAIAAGVLGLATMFRAEWRRPVTAMASGAIGVMGLVWMIQRI